MFFLSQWSRSRYVMGVLDVELRSTSTQVFTGAVPFSSSSPTVAMLAIMNGKRPSRPTHPTFTDGWWELTKCCWDQDPHFRPDISQVLQGLRNLLVTLPVL